MRVLVLDDDELYLQVVSRILAVKKYDVITTSNVDDFYRALKEHEVDMILLDVYMPGKSGFDIYAEIIDYKVPVLFVTGYPGSFKPQSQHAAKLWEQKERGKNVDVIFKPYKMNELFAKIDEMISRSQEQSEENA